MRVLHVPVKSTTYDSDEIALIISRALANFPSLNQLVLHFQGNSPDMYSEGSTPSKETHRKPQGT